MIEGSSEFIKKEGSDLKQIKSDSLKIRDYNIAGSKFTVKFTKDSLLLLKDNVELIKTLDLGVKADMIAENKKLDWYLTTALPWYGFISAFIIFSLFAFLVGVIPGIIGLSLCGSLLTLHTINTIRFNHKLKKNHLILTNLDKINENLATNHLLLVTLPKQLQKIIEDQPVSFDKPTLTYNDARRKASYEELSQFCRLIEVIEASKDTPTETTPDKVKKIGEI